MKFIESINNRSWPLLNVDFSYVTNLNTFSEQLAEAQQNGDVSKIISLQAAIK